MKALPLSVLAALCAAFFSCDAVAQLSIHARVGRHVTATVTASPVLAGHDHRSERGRARHAGRWETVCEQVLVPGYYREEHVPPSYGWIYDRCGHRHWGMIDRGGCRRVWVPERYETRHRRVWVRC